MIDQNNASFHDHTNEIQNNCKFGCVSDFNIFLLLFFYKDSTFISSLQPEHQNHIILQVQEAVTEAVQGSPCYTILWLFIQG